MNLYHLLKRYFFIPLLTLIPLLTAATQATASKEFETSFSANYTVNPDGTTDVAQQISLTNRFSNVYATQYALEIGSTRLENIQVVSSSGNRIPHKVTQTQNTTAIALTFQQKIVGKDKTRNFTISYRNLDIAIINGQVLEANIPKVSNLDDIENYSVNLSVPDIFGQPSVVNPKTYELNRINNTNVLSFKKEIIGNKGITVLFGDQQVFDLNLQYHLENPTVNKGITQIALPPDTAYQKVNYQDINPRPDKITSDKDGNWLATYTLKPKQKIDVIAKGQATLYLNPTVDIPNQNQNLNDYLTEQPFWPTNDPEIVKLANQLKTPKAIYDYLVNTLSYDYQRLDGAVERYGATKALKYPNNAICQEFTDTFITLARAAGIPARANNGFAYTQNSRLRPLSLVQDVLHAWPEYYDFNSQTWRPADPTWGNTTGGIDYFTNLDLNHFTFVIHGQNSITPYPAGYYKLEDTVSKDIQIDFAKAKNTTNPSFELNFQQQSFALPGLTSTGQLIVKNTTGTAYYNTKLDLDSKNYTLASQEIYINTLLPFTTQTVKLKLKPASLLQTSTGLLTVNLLGTKQTYEINSFTNNTLFSLTTISALVTIVALTTSFTRRILVSRQKQKSNLRWQSQEPKKPS